MLSARFVSFSCYPSVLEARLKNCHSWRGVFNPERVSSGLRPPYTRGVSKNLFEVDRVFGSLRRHAANFALSWGCCRLNRPAGLGGAMRATFSDDGKTHYAADGGHHCLSSSFPLVRASPLFRPTSTRSLPSARRTPWQSPRRRRNSTTRSRSERSRSLSQTAAREPRKFMPGSASKQARGAAERRTAASLPSPCPFFSSCVWPLVASLLCLRLRFVAVWRNTPSSCFVLIGVREERRETLLRCSRRGLSTFFAEMLWTNTSGVRLVHVVFDIYPGSTLRSGVSCG